MGQLYTNHDIDLIQNGLLLRLNAGTVEFQFPPVLKGDHRQGTWEEREIGGGNEPIGVFKTSGPRDMTLAWQYVIDGDQWTAARIHANITLVRGYFARLRDVRNQRDALPITLKLWRLGGNDSISARIKGINVTYEGGYIGKGMDAHNLITNVSVVLRIWTRSVAVEGEGAPVDDASVVVDVPGMKDSTPPDWF